MISFDESDDFKVGFVVTERCSDKGIQPLNSVEEILLSGVLTRNETLTKTELEGII